MNIVVKMKLITETKNCYRYEAEDDTVIKSALYLKKAGLPAALATTVTITDDGSAS